MSEKRPKVDYTMTWDCTFVIDGKVDEICLMTDDFEEVFEEYKKLKQQHKSVVFQKHELHRKGRMVLSPDMFGIPVEEPIAPVIDAEQPPAWMGRHNREIAERQLRQMPDRT